jgi:hypothetical protein
MAAHKQGCTAVAVYVYYLTNSKHPGLTTLSATKTAVQKKQWITSRHQRELIHFTEQPEAGRALIRLNDERVTLVPHNRRDKNTYPDM